MSKHTDTFNEQFEKIKKMGWVESSRLGDTGVGKTFEDLLGKKEDNNAAPDYEDIEVKVNKKKSSAPTTLFTKSPGNRGTNRRIREEFGVVDEKSQVKKLHTSVSTQGYNTHRSGNQFKLALNDKSNTLELYTQNPSKNEQEKLVTSWEFSKLEEIADNKLKNIAHISAEEKIENGKTFYHYTDVEHIQGITGEKVKEGIQNGDIVVELRLGVYRSGKKKGKPHDYGTAFRMNPNKIKSLEGIDSLDDKMSNNNSPQL